MIGYGFFIICVSIFAVVVGCCYRYLEKDEEKYPRPKGQR